MAQTVDSQSDDEDDVYYKSKKPRSASPELDLERTMPYVFNSVNLGTHTRKNNLKTKMLQSPKIDPNVLTSSEIADVVAKMREIFPDMPLSRLIAATNINKTADATLNYMLS